MKDAFTDDLSLGDLQMSLGEAKKGSKGPVSLFRILVGMASFL